MKTKRDAELIMSEVPGDEGMPLSSRRKTTFGGDVFKLVSGTAFSQGLVLLASPFLTRLYSPEMFGVFALFSSITSIMVVISCMRYELSIMLPKSDKEAANLLGVSLVFVALISLLVIPTVWWGRVILLRWLNAPALAPYLWLIPPAVFIGGVFLALNYWNSRTKHFTRLSVARVMSSTATVSIQLGAGYSGYATGGSLIGASVVGQAVSTTALGWQIWRDDRRVLLGSIHWKDMIAGIKRHRKFPMIDIWGALLNNISWQLPALMLSGFFSQTVVGYYAITFRLIKLPMSLIGGSIGQVFYQRASETRHEPKKLAENTEMVFRKLVSFCLFPALLLSVVGRETFSVIFGPAWAEAGVYAQILSIWMFWWFISSPLSSIFSTLERQGSALIVHTAILGSRLVSLVLGGVFKNIYLGLGLFAISGIVVYGGLAFWNLSLAGMPLRTSLVILLRYALFSLPGIGALLLLKGLSVGPAGITCVTAVELIVYYLIIMRTDPQIYRRIHSIISFVRRPS